MTDEFSTLASGLESPPTNGKAITPNDSTDLTTISRALEASTTAGTVRVTLIGMADGTSIDRHLNLGNPSVGRVKRVWATGTTATGIVALW